VARTSGFTLAHHTVFFSSDYRAEFDAIFARRQVPAAPTIYVCAQDRVDEKAPPDGTAERLFCLINAPASGDSHEFNHAEIESCEHRVFQRLRGYGLRLERNPQDTTVTTPTDFHRLFPATGGALYGPASHGWQASFTRPGSRAKIPGLYLAGGSTHPGPGIPMAATSGRLAAASFMADCASTSRWHPVATPGGTSTR
jgi:1-hydroxycarotenoid 3,4-desaturase